MGGVSGRILGEGGGDGGGRRSVGGRGRGRGTGGMSVLSGRRMDEGAGMWYEAGDVNAPEKRANIPVPKRASDIRVLMLELNRIANHLLWLGPFLADVGAQTPFFYIFREREMIYDLWEAATGQRMINNNTSRIGAVPANSTYGRLVNSRAF